MKLHHFHVAAGALFLLICVSIAPLCAKEGSTTPWPSFRGINARGIAENQNLPREWNPTTGENILWKRELPGLGHASPIVWGNKVFIVTAISSRQESKIDLDSYHTNPDDDLSPHSFRVLCFDLDSGKTLWESVAHEGIPQVKRHPKSTQANSTPVTNGSQLVVLFGAEGLYCYDMEGKQLWRKDVGYLDPGFFEDPTLQYGHASSPILYEDLVILQADRSKESFVAAYRLSDGSLAWKTNRSDFPSWSTPGIYQPKIGQAELIANGGKFIIGYDPKTGKELWRFASETNGTIPSPVFFEDLVILGASQPLFALRAGGRGNISETDPSAEGKPSFVAWTSTRAGSYIPTPLLDRSNLYLCHHSAILSLYDATSGERRSRRRLKGSQTGYRVTASPVAADGILYVCTEQGTVFLIGCDDKLTEIGENHLGEAILATPAISGGRLLIRSERHLFCIGKTR